MIDWLKKIAIKIITPLIGPLMRVLHLRILGHNVFINRYTRKIPGFNKIFDFAQVKIIAGQTGRNREYEYRRWYSKNKLSQKDINNQITQAAKLKKRPVISLIVPTYNTDHQHLKACIDSVIKQTYDNWQLCLADDKSSDTEVRNIIKQYADKDSRIDYVFRETNGHICEASNSALDLAKGKYVGLLDHDDELWPNALYEVIKTLNQHPDAKFIYSDEDKIDETGKQHVEPFFKPDWSFDFLRSINYITHFAVLDRNLIEKAGRFRKGYEGAQDWDLFLRASRLTDQIYHIPTVLYSWRKSATSTAQTPTSKDYAYINQKKALLDDIHSRNLEANLSWQIPYSMWRVDYRLKSKPLVSIVIPTKNQYEFIKRCLDSIRDKSTYQNFELVITDTGSDDDKVWDLYNEYKTIWPKTKIAKWTKPFNFSAACDFGAEHASGEYIIFLNNDTEVISPSWIEDMLGYAQQEEIGVVGCKLYYPNKKIQHAGIILGVGGQNGTPGIAGHFFPAFNDTPPQDPAQLLYIGGTRNFTAVTAACVMVSRAHFDQVKGFDPIFRIAFNDVDFCLKLYDRGLRNIYLPHVKLYHHESISIGKPGSKQRDLGEFAEEIQLMIDKWGDLIKNDPYYHPEFRRDIASARLNSKF